MDAMKTDNSIVLAGLIAFAVRTEGATPYLPVVGPSPIYFRAARPVGAALALPPLDMGRTPVNLEGAAGAAGTAGATGTTKGTPDTASWAPPTATETTAGSASPPPSPTPGPTVPVVMLPSGNLGAGFVPGGLSPDSPLLLPLSTQALIPFFTRQFSGDTNASKVTVVLPVEFHPAQPPVAPPSSRATFSQERKQP